MIQRTLGAGGPTAGSHALLWSGLITMAAIAYLLATMRAHRLTGRSPST